MIALLFLNAQKVKTFLNINDLPLRLTHNASCSRACQTALRQRRRYCKTSPLSCHSRPKNSHSYLPFSLSLSFLIQIKWQRLFLYSNENINIRHPASQSPSLLASHLNISYLQDISRFESSGLLSPARETTGKSETCHTCSPLMCHERTPFRG